MKIWVAITAILVAVDQYAKWLAFRMLDAPVWFAPDIGFKLAFNKGVAFSLPIEGWWAKGVSVAVIGLLVWFGWNCLNRRYLLTRVIFALIIGGALSNLIDRVRLGFVIDFIKVGNWPTFNLADVGIVAGCLLLVLFFDTLRLNKS